MEEAAQAIEAIVGSIIFVILLPLIFVCLLIHQKYCLEYERNS